MIQPVFTDAERLALAGYRGLTREAYALDLRQFSSWTGDHPCETVLGDPLDSRFARAEHT